MGGLAGYRSYLTGCCYSNKYPRFHGRGLGYREEMGGCTEVFVRGTDRGWARVLCMFIWIGYMCCW